MKLFSFILTTRKIDSLFLKAFKSVKNIKGINKINSEIIVVSPDLKATKLSQKNFVRVINSYEDCFPEKNGMPLSRNLGITNAVGKYTVLVDGDVACDQDWFVSLKPLLPVLDNENKLWGIQGNFWLFKGSNYWSKQYSLYKRRIARKLSSRWSNYFIIKYFDPRNFIAKTKIIKKYRFDEYIPAQDDQDFYNKIRKNYVALLAPNVKVFHAELNLFNILRKKILYGKGAFYRKDLFLLDFNELYFQKIKLFLAGKASLGFLIFCIITSLFFQFGGLSAFIENKFFKRFKNFFKIWRIRAGVAH